MLDVGAGHGAMSHSLDALGYRVVALGMDSDVYFASASAPFLTADAESLPVRPGSLEGITLVEVIEHLEAPLRFLRSAATALEPGGWLVLTTPNVQNIASRLNMLLRGHPVHFSEDDYRRNGHINPVSLVQIERMAERLGLELTAVRYTVGKLPIPRIRHRYPLRHPVFRRPSLGESLVVALRRPREQRIGGS